MKEQRGVQKDAVTTALLCICQHREFPISIYPSTFAVRGADSGRASTGDGLCNGGWSTAEYKSTRFPWMLYGVRGCQLLSACAAAGAPLDVVLVCDPNVNARTLIRTHLQCPSVVEDLGKLEGVVASDVKFNVIEYTMHVPLDKDRVFYAHFWEYQGCLIEDYRRRRGLLIVQIQLALACPPDLVDCFSKRLTAQRWGVKRQELTFQTFGDTIFGAAEFLFCMHGSAGGTSSLVPKRVHAPRDAPYRAIEEHLRKEYDQECYAIDFAPSRVLWESEHNLNQKVNPADIFQE